MMDLNEAIAHAEEKAKELRIEAEQLRDIGEVISNPKQPYNEPVKNCLACAEEHEQLAEWLKELKQLREQTGWIPVSKRLPEDFQRVLVTIVNYNGNKIVRVAEYYNYKGVFQIKENFEKWKVGEKGLLAWMPLPEPYEPQESEG